MSKLRKGDIVGRISYDKDILFKIEKIIKKSNGKEVAILKGLVMRIVADADIEDLVPMEKYKIQSSIKKLENRLEDRVKRNTNGKENEKISFLKRTAEGNLNGKILHLDGDRKYAEKSLKYYKKIGLDAIVRNIPENRQEYAIVDLLNRYKPDIVVITRT